MSNIIFYAFLDSFLGTIGLASSSSGLMHVDIGIKERAFLDKLKQKFPTCKLIKSEKKNTQAICELKSYLKGNLKSFDSKLNLKGPPAKSKSWRAGTLFQLKVWDHLRKIPYGKMCSYKFIARKVGKPTAVRAVGNVVANNPIPIFIPCHRVIKSDGNLGQYGPGENIKRKLLKIEGAI